MGIGTLTPTGIVADTYTFVMPDLANLAATYAALGNHANVTFFDPLIAREMSAKLFPNDPLFGDQWHLYNSSQGLIGQGVDINITGAWDNLQGDGVTIGVIDEGFDWLHPDLIQNYNPFLSYDYLGGDNDPYIDFPDEAHGTATAGLAAARGGNGQGVVGSAFRADWAGLRLISRPFTPFQEAGALHHRIQDIDIYSNSWGPPDLGVYNSIGRLQQAAIEDGVANGRGGLGNIYVWAAGNGLGSNDNVNYDGWANLRQTIAVGAIGFFGEQASYSEPGAAMLVTAPGGNLGDNPLIPEPNITTTDLFGTLGYNGLPDLDYTNDFNGTSAATPIVSGVIALMLQANPNLTWRDVQQILVETAVKNDPSHPGWQTNGAGRLVSHEYGHGLVDATAAVNAAATWVNLDPEVHGTTGVIKDSLPAPIPDLDPTVGAVPIFRTIDVKHSIDIESVLVTLDIEHSYRGDLSIRLVSPSGTISTLAEQHTEDAGDHLRNYTFMSTQHRNENSAGDWQIIIADELEDEVGVLNSWKIDFYGTGQVAPDQPPWFGTEIPSFG